jgi:sulfoxide reductase heme-binding subunit YedZ
VLVAESLTWYVTRAGGLVAFGLLTVAFLAGLMLGGRARSERWPRFALTEVHRFAGLLAACFVWLHVLVLLVDSYLPFSLADLVVPGAANYRPLATAVGVVAAELMVAVGVTNLLRARIPYRAWRRVHYLNFAVWLLALAHGIAAGSDTGAGPVTVLYGLSAASVAGLTTWRVLGRLGPRPGRPRALPTHTWSGNQLEQEASR